jgi:hypothetical protein
MCVVEKKDAGVLMVVVHGQVKERVRVCGAQICWEKSGESALCSVKMCAHRTISPDTAHKTSADLDYREAGSFVAIADLMSGACCNHVFRARDGDMYCDQRLEVSKKGYTSISGSPRFRRYALELFRDVDLK